MKYILNSLLLIFLFAIESYGQLSPGPLADPHAHLEGLSNCFKCHTIGSKIDNSKCLDCHTALKDRIDKRKGYHYASEIRNKSCVECHSDHHGKSFKMIKLDEDKFDHSLTGYKLEGSHKTVDCKSCHKSEYILDRAIREKDYTFLGLGTQCLDCHEDYHQNSLPKDCLQCHGMENFETTPHFDHMDTDFPLRGKHDEVDCVKCHEIIEKNGKEYQQFTSIDHNSCNDCHSDVHKGTLTQRCTECHSENTFSRINKTFNHNKTTYPLLGRHKNLECSSCHDNKKDLGSLFKEFEHVEDINCKQCHEDVHNNKFGPNCLDCHNNESFKIKGEIEGFDHDKTAFHLEGAHVTVDCKACHKGSLTDPVAHDECRACHDNYHKNSFSDENLDKDCISCHNAFSFSPSAFSINDHQSTLFPLEGAHLATPCVFCHEIEGNWEFNTLGTACTSCHKDIHAGQLDEKYYPMADCSSCHSTNNWQESHFNHDLTGYILEGRHVGRNCTECHKPDQNKKTGASHPVFKVSSECANCHNDVHRKQFIDDDNQVNCAKCHDFYNWDADKFDHDSTRFKLDGIHLQIDCAACHYEISDLDGTYTLYNINKIECSDCH